MFMRVCGKSGGYEHGRVSERIYCFKYTYNIYHIVEDMYKYVKRASESQDSRIFTDRATWINKYTSKTVEQFFFQMIKISIRPNR